MGLTPQFTESHSREGGLREYFGRFPRFNEGGTEAQGFRQPFPWLER